MYRQKFKVIKKKEKRKKSERERERGCGVMVWGTVVVEQMLTFR